MSVYKREFKSGDKWCVYLTLPDGRRYRRVVGTKKQAQQLHQRLQGQIAEGKWDLGQRDDVLFQDLVQEYLDYAQGSKAVSTFTADKSRIERHILPYFAKIKVRQITAQMVDAYKTKRVKQDAAPKSINNELLLLSHIVKMATRWRYTDRNVVMDVEKLKVPRNSPRFLNQAEIEQLRLAAVGSHIYPLIMTALHTGMRKSELLNLKWSDINFQMQTISVQSKEEWHTKNYKARTLQMTPALFNVLRRHLAQQAESGCEYVFTYNGKRIRADIRRSFGRVTRKAKLADVTLHTLRHTFASQLVMAGVPLRDVQELMGHQSYDTTLRYAHLAPDHVKKQVMNLPFAGRGV